MATPRGPLLERIPKTDVKLFGALTTGAGAFQTGHLHKRLQTRAQTEASALLIVFAFG